MTSTRVLNVSKPQFSHLQNGSHTYLIRWLEGLNEKTKRERERGEGLGWWGWSLFSSSHLSSETALSPQGHRGPTCDAQGRASWPPPFPPAFCIHQTHHSGFQRSALLPTQAVSHSLLEDFLRAYYVPNPALNCWQDTDKTGESPEDHGGRHGGRCFLRPHTILSTCYTRLRISSSQSFTVPFHR